MYFGATEIHFCESGVKTNGILQDVVEPLSDTLFEGVEDRSFRQDTAPAHKAKSTKKWCEDFLPNFITAEQWCSGSPDLNPLDYRLWTDLKAIVCKCRHQNLESLKDAIAKAAREFPLKKIHEAIDEWPKRLRRCVQAKDGHFEWSFFFLNNLHFITNISVQIWSFYFSYFFCNKRLKY